jgi:hypothetical protein
MNVTIPAKGPFTLCTGVFASRETFSLLRDSTGRIVWFARSWKAGWRPNVVQVFDSLTRQMVGDFGPATTCDTDRSIWWKDGFSLELRLKSMSAVAGRPDLDLPVWIHFTGQIGPPIPACSK